MSTRWKDLVPEGFDLDEVMLQTTQSEAIIRQRLKRCEFNVALALDDRYWAGKMSRKSKAIPYRGQIYSSRQLADLLGVSVSLVSRWFMKGLGVNQVIRAVMYGEVGPKIYGQDRVEGPPDWSSMGDMGPRVRLESLPEPTAWDEKYGGGPVNPVECRV